jgi:hypothetical protein
METYVAYSVVFVASVSTLSTVQKSGIVDCRTAEDVQCERVCKSVRMLQTIVLILQCCHQHPVVGALCKRYPFSFTLPAPIPYILI